MMLMVKLWVQLTEGWSQLTTEYFRRSLRISLLLQFAFDPSMKTSPDLLYMCLDRTQMIKHFVVG